jgi:non-specific serine/threonine protein kinase
MIELLTAERLNVEQMERVTPKVTVDQGREDFERGRVLLRSVEQQSAHLEVGDGKTGRAHSVSVWLQYRQVALICNCRQGYGGVACRHRVAAFLALRDYLEKNPPKVWKALLDRASQSQPRQTQTYRGPIVFSLQEQRGVWAIRPYMLAAKLFDPAELADQEAIASAINDLELSGEARPLRTRASRQNFPNAPVEAIAAANLAVSSPHIIYGGGYGSQPGASFEAMVPFLTRCLVYSGDEVDPLAERIRVLEAPGEFEVLLTQTKKGLQFQPRLLIDDQPRSLKRNETAIVARDPLWLLAGDTLVHARETDPLVAMLLDEPNLTVPTADQDEFLETYMLPLANRVRLAGDAIRQEVVNEAPQPRLYLREKEKELLAELRFGYGQHELPYEKRLPAETTKRIPGELALARIIRRPDTEEAAHKSLSSYGLKRTTEPSVFTLRAGSHTVDFLLRQIPRLAEAGFTIYGEEAIKSARVNRNRPQIRFNVSSGIDWFDVSADVSFGDLVVSLKDIRQAVKRRERYVKLTDGSIGELPPEWIDRYRKVLALGVETGDDTLRYGSSQVTLLDQLLGEDDRADAEFRERAAELRNFEGIKEHPLPPGFQGQLRPYQKFGYDWLHFLNEYGFGGCLADDMGTGKTISTLAFLESLYHEQPERPASLIVMPRSLLFNWQREAEKFTPELKLFVQADQGRISEPEQFGEYDLILTTYGTMLRDIELLRKYRFSYAILDESQAIKNPVAETSKAARLLQSDRRLVLTGTPVENSTTELWSQFAFLNPGLLGNLETFRTEFVSPIERNADAETANFLRRMVYPFILRRTKDQVASDLPPRSERVLVTDMDPAQRKAYDKQRDYYRALLLGMIEDEGMNDARMKILEGLLRLRQICNHPRLADAKYKGGSGKFELLIETLETLRAEGHRALVFSQFVQMLSLVREQLDARGIPYAYLDGQTRNRQAVVDQFQGSDELPFFLISLKAGGVGLNLTAADYVIHIDPWWNPAVEMQATDRTHRIGQDKPVFVYKLVVRDSVEEKILQLQEHKRELVEQVIGAEGGVFKSLTREDVEVLFT